MTSREPEEVNRKLRRWLWQEEQRWKRVPLADIAVRAIRDRDRITTADRVAGKAFAAAANAGAESITMTPKSARNARAMLGLDWPEVAKLARLLPSVVLGIEGSGPSTVPDRKMLQAFYEGEGLVFSRDGTVSWAE